MGAETTDCDSPISLINETFAWIEENLKDNIDFVVWTGDSARHDNDERIPRNEKQVSDSNTFLVNKFLEVFGKKDNFNDTDPTNDFTIPIIPTFGNNDILPHNIFTPGPNRWTKKFLDIWRQFIPEEQRHAFEKGGWYFVEVIPNQLTVFSLNTLYFFDSNSAVDGCADKSEPGHLQMEWLRIQLQFLRERGMKAILTGHVPPARTESKLNWDETCWQKYALWMHQYRDVVVGSLYGHMNIDHFMLQDLKDVDILDSTSDAIQRVRTALDDDLTTQSAADYLTELRARWSQIPSPPKLFNIQSHTHGSKTSNVKDDVNHEKKNANKKWKYTERKRSKKDKFLDEIGGEWGERYSLSLVAPSVVPNYFPTLRVIEYNITGLDELTSSTIPDKNGSQNSVVGLEDQSIDDTVQDLRRDALPALKKQKKNRGRKNKIKHKQKIKVPKSPSKTSPPGPAYSPQTLSWLGYTQYYANLTVINNDFSSNSEPPHNGLVEDERWKEGKHRRKRPKDKNRKPRAKGFKYEVEYDTRTDKVFDLKDLTVRSYINLATRIGQYKAKGSRGTNAALETIDNTAEDVKAHRSGFPCESKSPNSSSATEDKKKRKKKQGKGTKRKAANRVWFTFVQRAFVGTREEAEINDEFGQA